MSEFAQKVQTKCAKLVDEHFYQLFCCLKCSSWFQAKNIIQRCSSYKFKKKCSIESYIVYQKIKNKYVTVLLLILYSIWEKYFHTLHLIIKPLSWNKTLKMLGL